jgi:hypothetical protein
MARLYTGPDCGKWEAFVKRLHTAQRLTACTGTYFLFYITGVIISMQISWYFRKCCRSWTSVVMMNRVAIIVAKKLAKAVQEYKPVDRKIYI